MVDFLVLQPVWLAATFIVAAAVGSFRRLRSAGSRAADSPSHATTLPAGRAPALIPAVAWTRFALVVTLSAVAAIILLLARTSAARGALFGAAVIAVWHLTVQFYRHARTDPRPSTLCLAARIAACVILLVLIARPAWTWTIVDWQRPLLVVLLDESDSMAITDRANETENPPRVEIANEELRQAAGVIADLDRFYEVRVQSVGETTKAIDRWRITPAAPASALTTAVRSAGQMRSRSVEPPVAALLISDGAENVAEPHGLLRAADELARQQTALLTVGVGPAPGSAPGVIIEPLAVPTKVGSRDRISVSVEARVTGCAGHTLPLTLLWDDLVDDTRDIAIGSSESSVREVFHTRPPHPGLVRLTARFALPEELGGETVDRSVIIDVSDERIRVLYVEARPRSEVAFATRALLGDPRFEATHDLRPGGEDATPPVAPSWADYDVVIVGNVPRRSFTETELRDLANAVRDDGVGLLLVGGREFFNEQDYARSPLDDVSPVEFTRHGNPDRFQPRFQLTNNGRRHPIIAGVGRDDDAPDPSRTSSDVWEQLPPLAGGARLGTPRSLATVLALDQAGHAMLVAHEVGRGRSIAAAWDSTWPWALASDEGLRLHRQFWRQMAVWLANRRPSAWVLTDQPTYLRAAVAGGRQSIRIRAGVTGIDRGDRARTSVRTASLRLRRTTASGVSAAGPVQPRPSAAEAATGDEPAAWEIPLQRRRAEWVAELPKDLAAQDWLQAGRFELEFRSGASSDALADLSSTRADSTDVLEARSGFEIMAVDLERQSPTSNLALLRQAAERTASVGGRYVGIDELAGLLRELAETDRRRRVDLHATYDPSRQAPWLLFAALVAALGIEWAIRKRAGLP